MTIGFGQIVMVMAILIKMVLIFQMIALMKQEILVKIVSDVLIQTAMAGLMKMMPFLWIQKSI